MTDNQFSYSSDNDCTTASANNGRPRLYEDLILSSFRGIINEKQCSRITQNNSSADSTVLVPSL